MHGGYFGEGREYYEEDGEEDEDEDEEMVY